MNIYKTNIKLQAKGEKGQETYKNTKLEQDREAEDGEEEEKQFVSCFIIAEILHESEHIVLLEK